MSKVVRYTTNDGAELLVEVEDDAYGTARISRGDGIIDAGKHLEEVLEKTLTTVKPVVDAVRKLAPDAHEIEFGLKLNAEAGVLVAKTAMEGHFTVKLTWNKGP
ncbi:CU044_2847 family protein [Nonomuraea insulae]|uniref:CU044_2847 family protein n=1 Tax=Nonomuraea insulae TaxID=1616787 RepID=A0ABW1C9A4_9ACTN